MGFLSRRREAAGQDAPAAPEPGPAVGSNPMAGYDGLKPDEITAKLRDHSQQELGEIEEYERGHKERPSILAKLTYLRRSEPAADYDQMDADQVVALLGEADSRQVKAVRDYERKFQNRRQVMEAAATRLPEAPTNADDKRSRDEKVARVRLGMRRGPGQGGGSD